MSTHQPRIQVTLDSTMSKAIGALAAAESASLSATAARLIAEALELREDRALSELADARTKKTKKWLSHRDVWSNA